jgi:hypothetical protein
VALKITAADAAFRLLLTNRKLDGQALLKLALGDAKNVTFLARNIGVAQV